jgi:hypothetical protein
MVFGILINAAFAVMNVVFAVGDPTNWVFSAAAGFHTGLALTASAVLLAWRS